MEHDDPVCDWIERYGPGNRRPEPYQQTHCLAGLKSLEQDLRDAGAAMPR
jgi:hypothetical protein